ncbi:hypothetical protein QN277_009179 [Acacia crassicarpa]|uniref:Uncharacterized protein n=1 Tax=Acacia crassicarpa TaxID=499986 RepID=A0AAE1JND3_9FABA|nr:hypothetical protein QN277_009179 [Acacia crassicarpa]
MRYPLSEATALFNKSSSSRFPGPKQTNSSTSSSSGSTKQCTYCGKPRHTEATCYKKHGFPPGFKFRNSTVNAVSSEPILSQNFADSSRVANPSYGFTPDQYKRLLALVQVDTSTLPSASVNKISTNDIAMPNPTPVFRENDWFS